MQSRRTACGRKPYLLFAGTSLSWDDFGVEVAKLAQAFHSRGVRKGDRVAIMARNHIGHVLTLFAVARLGAIMVPVNPDFKEVEARYTLTHAEVSGVIASLETLAIVRCVTVGAGMAPWMILLDGSENDAPVARTHHGRNPGRRAPNIGAADDTCVIIYTSGTTGTPKGVMHSQRSFVTAGEAFVQRVHLQES